MPAAPTLAALALLPATVLPCTTVEATFDRPDGIAPVTAVSFVPEAVPYGATARVVVERAGGTTTVSMEVDGLTPDHTYPVHAHVRGCGTAPGDSGPHYQDVPDPVQPSTDPGYANDHNELWLTLRTDSLGRAAAHSTVAWEFRPGGAGALVLHAGEDGQGHSLAQRVGCVNVDF
ncbi:superoxide dismutase family protein [Kitasatospora sp. NPDC096147]|uniref:superoxide dismutase family protein n=1 Tax=Kitasatospora sp. NPDC096147 TaxID=3364093 RepID=UPI0037F39A35